MQDLKTLGEGGGKRVLFHKLQKEFQIACPADHDEGLALSNAEAGLTLKKGES